MSGLPLEKRCGGNMVSLLAAIMALLFLATLILLPVGTVYFLDYLKHDGIEFTHTNCTALNAMALYQIKESHCQLNVEVQYILGDQIYNTVFTLGEYKTRFEANAVSKYLLSAPFPCYVHPNDEVPRLESYSVADELAPGLTMFILGITFIIVSLVLSAVLDRAKEVRKQREAEMAKKADIEKGTGSGLKTSATTKKIDTKVSDQY